jgi:hypothetical protein
MDTLAQCHSKPSKYSHVVQHGRVVLSVCVARGAAAAGAGWPARGGGNGACGVAQVRMHMHARMLSH